MFGFLIEKYENKLFYFIKRTINVGDGDAEDILQEVFIKAYKGLNGFDTYLKFSSWIYRIAYNHTISYYRKHKDKTTLSIEDSEVLMATLKDDLDIEEEANTKIDQAAIRDAIDSLDKKYRDVLVLKFLEEKSYEELSDILRKPMGTIATLINRAKKQLKDKLN